MATWMFVCIWILWALGFLRVILVTSKYSVQTLMACGFGIEVLIGVIFTVVWFSYLIFG